MTQKEKIREAIMFAQRMKRIANNIKSEGDDYDMTWHKTYVAQITEAADEVLDTLLGKSKKK